MKVTKEEYRFTGALDKRTETKHIIIHHAAVKNASAQAIHAGHLANGWFGIGYHYYVRKNGEVFTGRPEDTQGVHTGNMNGCSIGVCFEGNFEEEEMPEAQLNAGRELIADLRARYKDAEISRHRDWNATACPGKNFPFEEMLKAAPDKTQPSEWAREAAEWAVEKGIFAGDGDGNYRWHDFITREEMAVVLRKIAQ